MEDLRWIEIGKDAVKSACDDLDRAKSSLISNQDNIKITGDMVAHSAILRILKSYGCSCSVYSEESPQVVVLGDQPTGVSVVVDPLDGSYFFLKGAREFCSTGLMIIKDGRPIASFVRSLDGGHTYYCDEQESYRGNKGIRVSKAVLGPPSILIWAPMKHLFTELLHRLDPLAKDCRIFNNCGQIHSAQLAEGYYDAVIELLPVPLYEFCGAVIAWRAGANLSTVEGKQIVFNPAIKQTLVVSRSIALHNRILDCLN